MASKEGTEVWNQCCAKPWKEENKRDQGHPPVSPLLQSYQSRLVPVRQPLADMT
jgi:hypothetical protein